MASGHFARSNIVPRKKITDVRMCAICGDVAWESDAGLLTLRDGRVVCGKCVSAILEIVGKKRK